MKKPPLKTYNPNPRTIGEHVRKVRIERGLLQSEVARILRTCEDTVTGWENGRGNPVVSLYPSIIGFLGYYPHDHPVGTVAGLIERCRHTLGLSYKQLGERVVVNGSTVIHWKQLGCVPNDEHLLKLEALLINSHS